MKVRVIHVIKKQLIHFHTSPAQSDSPRFPFIPMYV